MYQYVYACVCVYVCTRVYACMRACVFVFRKANSSIPLNSNDCSGLFANLR